MLERSSRVVGPPPRAPEPPGTARSRRTRSLPMPMRAGGTARGRGRAHEGRAAGSLQPGSMRPEMNAHSSPCRRLRLALLGLVLAVAAWEVRAKPARSQHHRLPARRGSRRPRRRLRLRAPDHSPHRCAGRQRGRLRVGGERGGVDLSVDGRADDGTGAPRRRACSRPSPSRIGCRCWPSACAPPAIGPTATRRTRSSRKPSASIAASTASTPCFPTRASPGTSSPFPRSTPGAHRARGGLDACREPAVLRLLPRLAAPQPLPSTRGVPGASGTARRCVALRRHAHAGSPSSGGERPLSSEERDQIVALYDANLAYGDALFGSLMTALSERGLRATPRWWSCRTMARASSSTSTCSTPARSTTR